ncbi:PREDICTED: protein argonaute 7-like [Camelina sativa]|uniref:Protein argonaute 7-like n=1 Tax=Camelina sativa TaxID=90675 RepID=A0ABM0YJ26_CAMSA|nr:PREDICTED: protein argonaute 7-like [Camelina sativa]
MCSLLSESRSREKDDLSSFVSSSFVNHRNELKTKMLKDMGVTFDEHGQVMFIGGYVNHLADRSIAAVVGTVDWPKTKPYAAMVRAQTQGEERIQRFGEGCSKLVEAHIRESGKKPNKIVIFRYEVGKEILQDELQDLKNKLGGYTSNITVIVATKHASDPERDDDIDFYSFSLGVRFDFEFFYNSGNFSMTSLLLYLCSNETTTKIVTPLTYTFQMVPPITTLISPLSEYTRETPLATNRGSFMTIPKPYTGRSK